MPCQRHVAVVAQSATATWLQFIQITGTCGCSLVLVAAIFLRSCASGCARVPVVRQGYLPCCICWPHYFCLAFGFLCCCFL